MENKKQPSGTGQGGVRRVPAEHQGGGVYGQVRGEELQQQALHRHQRQRVQPQPPARRQQGQSQASQPGSQTPQQPQRRHRGLKPDICLFVFVFF